MPSRASRARATDRSLDLLARIEPVAELGPSGARRRFDPIQQTVPLHLFHATRFQPVDPGNLLRVKRLKPWDTIMQWVQEASPIHRLNAYGVASDGSRMPLDCEVIVVELDAERRLLIALSERGAGEGVAICSLPPAVSPSAQARFSTLSMRSGGANLFYLSPELHPSHGTRLPPPPQPSV